MKYIIFCFEGNGLPIAYHLQKEGHDVIVGQVENMQNVLTSFEKKVDGNEDAEEKKQRLSLYNNMLEKMPADDLIKKIESIKNKKEYFILFESNTLFKYAGRLKNLGFNGTFPTEENRTFEINRNLAKDFVKKYYPNLKVAIKKQFTSIIAAEKFLKDTKHLWVLKSQTDAIPTFVPNTEDIKFAKQQVIENLKVGRDYYEASGFFLEQKIPNIIELTPEKMYYDGTPIGMNVMIENKFIGSGNISFQVGCGGDIVFPVSEKNKIHDLAFPPIVDEIAKKHKGLFIWDASLLINSQTGEMYFGEFCPNRLGYNSFFTTLEQMPSINHFFESVANKKNPFLPETVGVSVTMFNLLRDPNTQALLSDVAINYPENYAKHIWPYNVYKKKHEETLYTVGYDIHLSPITASEKTFMKSVDSLYKYAESFAMNNVYYRPKFDFLSRDYSTSILNRLQYCIDKKLFDISFKM